MFGVLEVYHSSPVGCNIVVFELRSRSCNVGTIGPSSTKRLMILQNQVIVANDMKEFKGGNIYA